MDSVGGTVGGSAGDSMGGTAAGSGGGVGADLLVIAGDDDGLANFGNEVADGALRAEGARAGSCLPVSDVREVGVGMSRSLKLPVKDVPVDLWLEESFLGAIRSLLLGGGAMGCDAMDCGAMDCCPMGSGLLDGLTKGGGTKSRS